VGTWNSIQSEKTLSRGGGTGPGNWYESDFYTGFKFDFADTVEVKPFYYLYMYPNGAFPSIQEMDVAVSLFDVSDYYESPSGRDQAFGFYKGGVTFSVPLGFMPEEYGAWSIAAGPAVYVFNSNLRHYNQGNNPWVVGTVSLNFSY